MFLAAAALTVRVGHSCASLELFAQEVIGEFKAEAADLAPYLKAAMGRKRWMAPLAEGKIAK